MRQQPRRLSVSDLRRLRQDVGATEAQRPRLGQPADLGSLDGAGYLVDTHDPITFPQASGSWGTITHFGIFDAATSGNLLMHGALSASKTVGANDTFLFAAGDLNLRLEWASAPKGAPSSASTSRARSRT